MSEGLLFARVHGPSFTFGAGQCAHAAPPRLRGSCRRRRLRGLSSVGRPSWPSGFTPDRAHCATDPVLGVGVLVVVTVENFLQESGRRSQTKVPLRLARLGTSPARAGEEKEACDSPCETGWWGAICTRVHGPSFTFGAGQCAHAAPPRLRGSCRRRRLRGWP